MDRHFIKDNIEAKTVELPFVRSEDQLVDILTKAVDTKSFHEVLGKLRMADPVT